MIINRVAEHAGHDAPQQRTLESSDVSVKVENYATEMGIDTRGSMADAFRHESYTPLDGKDDFGSNTISSDMMEQSSRTCPAPRGRRLERRSSPPTTWEAN